MRQALARIITTSEIGRGNVKRKRGVAVMATPLSLSLLVEFQAEIAKIVIVAFQGGRSTSYILMMVLPAFRVFIKTLQGFFTLFR